MCKTWEVFLKGEGKPFPFFSLSTDWNAETMAGAGIMMLTPTLVENHLQLTRGSYGSLKMEVHEHVQVAGTTVNRALANWVA